MECDKKDVYSKVLLDNIEGLRRSEKFSDFELKSGNTVIKVHRLVLAAASPYFEAMFTSDFEESQRGWVKLPTVAPDVLTALVDFMYTGKLQIIDNVQQLMIAADMFQLKHAVTTCVQHMQSQLAPSNAVGTLRFAEKTNQPTLAGDARRYVLQNWSAAAAGEEFLDIPYSLLIELISSDSMMVKCESEVLHAVLRWLDHKPKVRARHCLAVLRHVRLRLVPQNYLKQVLNTNRTARVTEILEMLGGALELTAPRQSQTKLGTAAVCTPKHSSASKIKPRPAPVQASQYASGSYPRLPNPCHR